MRDGLFREGAKEREREGGGRGRTERGAERKVTLLPLPWCLLRVRVTVELNTLSSNRTILVSGSDNTVLVLTDLLNKQCCFT